MTEDHSVDKPVLCKEKIMNSCLMWNDIANNCSKKQHTCFVSVVRQVALDNVPLWLRNDYSCQNLSEEHVFIVL